MKNKLLTKHCALTLLMALLAATWSTNAWADVTVNVKCDVAPHIYAWDNSQNKLTENGFPGDVMSETKVVKGITYYTMTFEGASSINLLFTNNDLQTGDFNGLTGEVFFNYDGAHCAYGKIPDNIAYEAGNVVYFVNTKNWTNVNCHLHNGGTTSTNAMTYVALDGAGQKIYKWGPQSLSFTPSGVIFNNGGWANQGGVETPSIDYAQGGYYVYSEYNNGSNKELYQVATIDASRITNSATYFADAHFREGITKSLGVAEGAAFTPADYTILDLSYDSGSMTGKISNISGIEHFTNLEELDISNNNIPYGDITALTKLKKIVAHHNPSLEGFGIGDPSSSNKILKISPSSVLEYVDVSNNDTYYLTQLNNCCGSTLETLIASNNPRFDYSTFSNCTVLKHLDFSNCGLTSTALNSSHINCPNLEYLDCSGNRNLVSSGVYLTNMTKLKYFDMSGCDATPATTVANLANAKSSLEYLDLSDNNMPANGNDPALDGFTALQTFKFNTQANWTKSLTITNCPSLTLIDVSGNVKMTGLTINNSGITTLNFPEATTLTGLTALTTLNVSNNPFTVLNIPQTPNSLLTVTANDCSAMTRILAEHNKSKLQYVTAHNCPALTDITINGADIYFNKQLNAFDATNKSTLLTLDLSNDAMSTNYALDGFTALQTVDFDNNYMTGNENNISSFTAINCPSLTSVNLDGNANMETITLKSNGFSNSSYPVVTVDAEANNVTLDFSDNNFTAVPNIEANQIKILKLNDNQLADINIPDGCNVQYLYAQNNNFPTGDYTLPTTSLVGLDLGNNDFTKFKAENNTSLKSLALAGNDNLTEIELHGNTALTQTSPDGIIESDNGLYIKGLSNLKVLNIENSSFNKLGQQHSLQGVTALETLKARHNEFTTFTNGVYALDVAGTGNYRKPDNTESSLEHLTALEYLDLAYNNLQDSVHLYKNVALKHLDVSHNNEIHGVIDGTITADNTAAQEAMRTKKAKRLVKYGMYYGDKGELTDALYAQACADQSGRQVRFDIRYEDLNDTTGIYHLDLQKNVNLEWIDISYTNIHNTAAGPGVMNPGWMSRDWVGDSDEALAATVHANTTTHRSYSAFHTFVYFAPCSKLKTIHMDHCNLQSLGVSYFPELDTLTCSYMYGDCYFMRDATKTDLKYGMANTGPGRVRKYLSPKTNTETGIQDAVNVIGPDGTPDTYYDNNIKYYDISYSGFNELRFNYGINLEHIDVSGNPLKFHVHPNSDNSYYNSLDVTYCPNIRTVLAENCADLPIVRAHNRTKLDTLYLSNDPNLKTLYVQNDPLLKTNFQGLNTLTGLETLFAYNNTHWGNDITFASNTALKNLWISNIGASQLNLTTNKALQKLRAYDNILGSEDENRTIDLSNNTALEWLDLARNLIANIDLSHNTALQFVNFSNGNDTRIELDGTEQLNHDGSDGDAIKPTTIFSADETPIQSADAGNSLSDLALPASITDARANGNDLHSITGSFANLTNIEFAHNHINGITLPSSATVESRDNGRTITADCAKFTPHGDFGNVVTVYFFQLADLSQQEVQNGTQLTLKTSDDIKGATRKLGTDGLVLDNINWNQSNAGMLRNVTLNPSNMGQYLDPDEVPGSIVVLEAASETDNGAEGTATYTYNNGTSTPSEFYLNWSSDGTITGIGSVIGDNGFDLAGTYGGIVVAGKDGTVVGVYDLNGRQVASETITDGKAVINDLTPGIYLVNGQKVLVK